MKRWLGMILLVLAACSSTTTATTTTTTRTSATTTTTERQTTTTTSTAPVTTTTTTTLPATSSSLAPSTTAAGSGDEGALPDPNLTPGVVLVTDKATICTAGYATNVRASRPVSDAQHDRIFAAYGVDPTAIDYQLDHLVSLELGGAPDSDQNLWPQPATPLGFHEKDTLENKLHDLVCAGKLDLSQAQQQEAADWIATYHQYVTPKPTTTTTKPPATTAAAPSHPAGATALCKDGSYSYSPTHSGSCSHHGGVAVFYS